MEAGRAEQRRPPARGRDPLRRAAALEQGAEGGYDVDPMVKEEVDDEDVAMVVARWTGIPVSRLMEGEVKLVRTWRSGSTSG